jgi:molecular chaperone DnaJ
LRQEQEIKIKIPAGIENGEMIRLSGQGEAVSGGVNGDLYVKIHVTPHPTFKKEGDNLAMVLPLKLSEALLGGTYDVETLDGKISVKVPPATTLHEVLRVRGKGIPGVRGRGDLLIRIQIEFPKKISKKATDLISQLKDEGI